MTAQVDGPVVGEDGLARCPWGAGSEVYRAYHDTEWGVPVHGEAAYLERLTLEAFQSGLSWLTILNKREAFREVFAGFDADVVAAYDDADFDRLMGDARIVRNRLKVRAAIANAAGHGGRCASAVGSRTSSGPSGRRTNRLPKSTGEWTASRRSRWPCRRP